jgi:hypothetical protein
MRYGKTINIWDLPQGLIKYLQPGQWVSTGPSKPGDPGRGRFWGVKPRSGIVVVAWQGNARGDRRLGRYADYQRNLRRYATAA